MDYFFGMLILGIGLELSNGRIYLEEVNSGGINEEGGDFNDIRSLEEKKKGETDQKQVVKTLESLLKE